MLMLAWVLQQFEGDRHMDFQHAYREDPHLHAMMFVQVMGLHGTTPHRVHLYHIIFIDCLFYLCHKYY